MEIASIYLTLHTNTVLVSEREENIVQEGRPTHVSKMAHSNKKNNNNK